MTEAPVPPPEPPETPALRRRARRDAGWRGFAKEVAIVVLGVLIALGAQETVQWMHWRDEVAETREALNHELANDRARLRAMAAQDRCYDLRLETLERWAALPNRPAIVSMTNGTIWNLRTSAWDVAMAGQTAAHMPLADRLRYSQVYAVLERMRDLMARESDADIDVFALTLGPRAADPDGVRLMGAIARLRSTAVSRRGNHATLERYFQDLGVEPDTSSMRGVTTSDLCAPPVFAAPGADASDGDPGPTARPQLGEGAPLPDR